MNKTLKLNLGCGKDIKENYINVDDNSMWPDKLPANVVPHNLSVFPWPFKDYSSEEIYMSHVLEHLPDTTRTLKEIKRILKIGGIFWGVVPVGNSLNGQTHWQHCRYFNKWSFCDISKDFGMELIYSKFDVLHDTTFKRIRNLVPFKEVLYKAGWNNAYDLVHFKLKKI